MTFNEFLELVEKMRHVQKEYFRTKGGNLSQCKAIERRVDLACQKLRDGQKELFEK